MEKQGIITGIGNEITPEIDAVINDYIVGKNAIINGLEITNKILSAGTCQLCGYRGVLEKSVEVSGEYIYGVFKLNFDKDIEDEFYIEDTNTKKTTNVNPTSITSAGTYYVLLYSYNSLWELYIQDIFSNNYPKQAHIADKADNLQANGTIYSTATTVTANVNDNSNRVANTKYVHNQIEAEVAKLTKTGSLLDIYGTARGSYSLTRKAKLVTIDLTFNGDWAGVVQKFVPNDCLPNKTIYFFVVGGNGMTSCLSMNTNGDIQLVSSAGNMSTTVTTSIGYECQ